MKKIDLSADFGYKRKQLIIWLVTFVFSMVYIFAGHYLCTKDLDIFDAGDAYAAKARVTQLGEFVSTSYDAGAVYENSIQYFSAKILKGDHKGEIVLAAQTSDNFTNYTEKPVSPGDKVILYNYGTKEGDADFVFGGYEKLDANLAFLFAFFVLLIVFGQHKGITTIVSLSFTCLAVFAVFVPSVLCGYNIYLSSSITCFYTIVMTLLITNGATHKSLTTILGCSFGVAVAAAFSLIFDKIMKLTGMLDEHSIYLQYLSSGVQIDLNALIFAMIIIGAMGAVMDVAMDISSSLYEVHAHAEDLSFRELFMSGIRIGRDVMGTMANTLVLAYIGSSLCSILLLITYSSSLLELLNRENIAVEILQALIGSTAILLTIPLTSIVCAFLYTKKVRPDQAQLARVNVNLKEFKEWSSDSAQDLKKDQRR